MSEYRDNDKKLLHEIMQLVLEHSKKQGNKKCLQSIKFTAKQENGGFSIDGFTAIWKFETLKKEKKL